MADFPNRDAAYAAFIRAVDQIDDIDLRSRVRRAGIEYAHEAAVDAIKDCARAFCATSKAEG